MLMQINLLLCCLTLPLSPVPLPWRQVANVGGGGRDTLGMVHKVLIHSKSKLSQIIVFT